MKKQITETRSILLLIFMLISSTVFADDVIVTKASKKIDCKITEVTTMEVKYKRINMLDGATFTILKSDILNIIWSDGSVEIFEEEKEKEEEEEETQANDVIVTIDGKIIDCKIIEITYANVQYKRIDMLEGATFSLPVSAVQNIVWSDGRIDVLEKPEINTESETLEEEYPYIGYHGEFSPGLGFLIGSPFTMQLLLKTTHGFYVDDYFSMGVGTGFNPMFQFNSNFFAAVIPLFANLKGYLPFDGQGSVYLSLDIGGYFSFGKIYNYITYADGLLVGPALGITFNDVSGIEFFYNYMLNVEYGGSSHILGVRANFFF